MGLSPRLQRGFPWLNFDYPSNRLGVRFPQLMALPRGPALQPSIGGIRFEIDTTQLGQVAVAIAQMRGSLTKNMSRAINFAAWDAQKKLKADTPRYVDRPTPWTVNATFIRKSTPEDLSLAVGFKDEASKGTPAAKYLQPIVAGEARRQKASERRLGRSSVMFAGKYLIPTGKPPLTLDSYGNVPRGKMTQVLSRIRALDSPGSTGNASSSRRSRGKRKQNDFFVGYRSGVPITINQRIGTGYANVFNITSTQPKYTARFPVKDILGKEINSRFPSIFERLVFKEK
jgi:hypothetical protein